MSGWPLNKMPDDFNPNEADALPRAEPTFAMSVRRTMPNGTSEEIAWDGYALLQELVDDILHIARRRGWLNEPEEPHP